MEAIPHERMSPVTGALGDSFPTRATMTSPGEANRFQIAKTSMYCYLVSTANAIDLALTRGGGFRQSACPLLRLYPVAPDSPSNDEDPPL
jgi:hypothetical protein